jgi:hypothetical protein
LIVHEPDISSDALVELLELLLDPPPQLDKTTEEARTRVTSSRQVYFIESSLHDLECVDF